MAKPRRNNRNYSKRKSKSKLVIAGAIVVLLGILFIISDL